MNIPAKRLIVILMKDRNGRVIGFEKLNVLTQPSSRLQVAFETSSHFVISFCSSHDAAVQPVAGGF